MVEKKHDNQRDVLAQERTHQALERIGVAEEHTFAAWMCTGLAMVGAGLAAAKLLPDTTGLSLARLFGIVLVLAGGSVFILGFNTYHCSLERLLQEGYELAPLWAVGSVTMVLILSALLALVLILL